MCFCHAIVIVPLAYVQHMLTTWHVRTGEGLGFLWPYLAGYPTDKIAVIDKACAMRPGRPTMPWVLPQPKQVKLKMRLQVRVASVTLHTALPEASGQPISGFSCCSCRTLLLFLSLPSCTWASCCRLGSCSNLVWFIWLRLSQLSHDSHVMCPVELQSQGASLCILHETLPAQLGYITSNHTGTDCTRCSKICRDCMRVHCQHSAGSCGAVCAEEAGEASPA